MAQYPGVPWNQRPDYLALTQRVDPAGVVTTYNPPRPGVSATDVTSFVYGQAGITLSNWPEIMYYLHPPAEWTAFRGTASPQQRTDANAQPMCERFPRQGQPARPLLDFPILPDTICSQEELWWIELWRRMDPRIRWADILMRIEVPNRTAESDRKLQNSTNNLINRREHPRYLMLAWHSTGANGVRSNRVRTMVLREVAAAHPPLPPNSTRGLTPGLINPQLGNVPGNVVPHPPLGDDHGRLRVPILPQFTANQALANAAQANPAQANPAQANPAQANPAQANVPQPNQIQTAQVQNNQGRDNREGGNGARQKRNRTSPDPEGRPSKRQGKYFIDDTMDNDMDTRSDGAKSSEDLPLSVANVRAQVARTQIPRNSTTSVKAMKRGIVKRKPELKVAATAKKIKKPAGRRQQDSTTDSGPEHDEDGSERGDSSAGAFYFEDDPGFEAAFQASRRGRPRRQAQDNEHSSRPPRRTSSTNPLTRHTTRDNVSDSEILGDSEEGTDDESDTLMGPAQLSGTTIAPRVSALFAHPANTPTPVRRPNISAITGLPFAGPNRRPEALSPYGDNSIHRRNSHVSSSRATPSTSVHSIEDNHGRPRNFNTTSAGLPIAPEDRPPQSYYTRFPDGSYEHYREVSGRPAYMTHPGPSSDSRTGFTPNQLAHGQAQTNTQPPYSDTNTQPVSPFSPIGRINYATDTDTIRQNTQNPSNAPNGQSEPTYTKPPTRLIGEIVRHDSALIEEFRRREHWSREEYGRHTGVIFEMLRGDEEGYATGFLEREMERERKERQPSTDNE